MRRSIAMVAAIMTVSLGLIASVPAKADGGYGHRYGSGQNYGHGYYGKSYAYRGGYRGPYYHGGYGGGYGGGYRRGYSDDTFLTAVGIIAGARVVSAYLQGPPVYQSTVIYAAPVQPRACYQVMVPYASPYGGYYYVPQLQCY